MSSVLLKSRKRQMIQKEAMAENDVGTPAVLQTYIFSEDLIELALREDKQSNCFWQLQTTFIIPGFVVVFGLRFAGYLPFSYLFYAMLSLTVFCYAQCTGCTVDQTNMQQALAQTHLTEWRFVNIIVSLLPLALGCCVLDNFSCFSQKYNQYILLILVGLFFIIRTVVYGSVYPQAIALLNHRLDFGKLKNIEYIPESVEPESTPRFKIGNHLLTLQQIRHLTQPADTDKYRRFSLVTAWVKNHAYGDFVCFILMLIIYIFKFFDLLTRPESARWFQIFVFYLPWYFAIVTPFHVIKSYRTKLTLADLRKKEEEKDERDEEDEEDGKEENKHSDSKVPRKSGRRRPKAAGERRNSLAMFEGIDISNFQQAFKLLDRYTLFFAFVDIICFIVHYMLFFHMSVDDLFSDYNDAIVYFPARIFYVAFSGWTALQLCVFSYKTNHFLYELPVLPAAENGALGDGTA